jgi:hypothetical protein
MSETQEVKKPNGAPPPEPVTRKNLVQKLCEVMAAVERVAKHGRNEFHKYDYAREADIVEAIRGELASRNLFIFPDVTAHARAGEITDIMVGWTFVDGDSGEERTCHIPGAGQDKGDKGVYKALTGSEKYFLMKAFLIPTGDDPEKESKDERKEVKQEQREAAKKVAEQKIAGHFRAIQANRRLQKEPGACLVLHLPRRVQWAFRAGLRHRRDAQGQQRSLDAQRHLEQQAQRLQDSSGEDGRSQVRFRAIASSVEAVEGGGSLDAIVR